jgi:hypothetical protein
MRPDTGGAKIPGGQEYKEFSKITWAGHRNAHPHQANRALGLQFPWFTEQGNFRAEQGNFSTEQ